MRFTINFIVHVRKVNDMTLPLFEKSSQGVENRPMRSNPWLFPQTVSRLLLLCLTICGLPRPKTFQQNGGLTAGHRIKPNNILVSSS